MNMTKGATKDLSNNLVLWGGDDPFTHTLVIGPTRCGKTSTILEPLIFELLKAKKRGEKCGLTLIEPKGDVARLVYEMSVEMGLTDDLVYVDPLFPNTTKHINVMKGDKNDVAEATVAVLKSLFGKQDAFFATVQELSSRKVTLLLKELYADNMDILDVLANLRDEQLLKQNVETYRSRFGTNDLVTFFDHELLGSGNMAEKYRQFIVGLRSQLENITSNEYLRSIVTGKSDVDLNEHLERGGILAINTALGLLGKSGDAFGMFMMMHMQLATFRRKGTERTRVPHYFIVDELSRYINPDLERFLSIAASYRVAFIGATQSPSQLEVESGTVSAKAMKNAILTSTRNKIVFGGLEYEDAKEISNIMGTEQIVKRSRTYDGGILKNILPKIYKDDEEEVARFHPTLLMDGLPRFHCICKLLKDGTPQEPFVAKGEWIPRDWKEQLLREESEKVAFSNRKKPSILKWRERALYEVEKYEHENANKLRTEKQQKLLNDDPFSNFTTETGESEPVALSVNSNHEEKQGDVQSDPSQTNATAMPIEQPVNHFNDIVFNLSKTPMQEEHNQEELRESIVGDSESSNTVQSPLITAEPSKEVSFDLSKSKEINEEISKIEEVLHESKINEVQSFSDNSESNNKVNLPKNKTEITDNTSDISENVVNGFWGNLK